MLSYPTFTVQVAPRIQAVLGLSVFSLFLLVIQTVLGEDVATAAAFSGATFFGLLAVSEAGLLTAFGILNLFLVTRFLLVAYLMKNVLMGEPIGAHLQDPESTGLVMLLGFAGVFLGTTLVKGLVRPLPPFRRAPSAGALLALTITLFCAGRATSVAILLSGGGGEGAISATTTGGIWGILKMFPSFSDLSIATALLYLWKTKSPQWMLHPMVLLLVAINFAFGIISTSKQGMLEPLAVYMLMGFLRYRLSKPALPLLAAIAALTFQFFIAPVSQYVRGHGGRDVNAITAVSTTIDVVSGYLTDGAFRQRVLDGDTTQLQNSTTPSDYLTKNLALFSRFAMVAEADRLVAATDCYRTYTGWQTIVDGLLLAVPHFLYPQKPQLGTNNFFGRYTEDLAEDDRTTQVSYGFFANWYNAFGLAGVFVGTMATASFLFLITGLVSTGAIHTSPWPLLTVMSMNHGYVEESMSGQIGVIHMPLMALSAFLLAWFVERWFFHNANANTKIAGTSADTPAVHT